MSHFILQSYRRRLSRWRDEGRERASELMLIATIRTHTGIHSMRRMSDWARNQFRTNQSLWGRWRRMLYLRYVRDMEIRPIVVTARRLDRIREWKPCKLEQLLLLYGAATSSIVPVSHITLIRASLNSGKPFQIEFFQRDYNNDINCLIIIN